ncbi:MAG: hypothetical protein GXC73_18475 [Chitinophagaceae bacterium]|nr:hypothetical protein [Chitinophagaceae bacterium]
MFKSKNTYLFLFILSLFAVIVNLILAIRNHGTQDRMDLFIRITSVLLFLYFSIDHFLAWKNFREQQNNN